MMTSVSCCDVNPTLTVAAKKKLCLSLLRCRRHLTPFIKKKETNNYVGFFFSKKTIINFFFFYAILFLAHLNILLWLFFCLINIYSLVRVTVDFSITKKKNTRKTYNACSLCCFYFKK